MNLKKIIKLIDSEALLFFGGVFVVVGGLILSVTLVGLIMKYLSPILAGLLISAITLSIGITVFNIGLKKNKKEEIKNELYTK